MTFSAAEIASAVRSGELTARQATEDALERAFASAGHNAFQVIRGQAALREADAIDAADQRRSLPLAGVPVVIKDNVPVAGEPMRNGSLGTDPTAQTADHEVVRRLKAAGAVVIGITRVPELCAFGATDSAFGITRNPWNLDRTPGGSSGGAAAAVAAGVVPLAHGNDGMGSVRIPAACCGLVGIKPGLGVVPADLGNGSWFDMAENGVLSTTVKDAALMLSVMADRPELAELTEPLKLRIAVSTKVPAFAVPLADQWKQAARSAGERLGVLGHAVADADPAYGLMLTMSELARWTAGTELDAQRLADRSAMERRTRRHARMGRALMAAGFPRDKGRTRWQRRAEKFFADHDVLVTPMLAKPALEAQRWSERGWIANLNASFYAPFAAPWNVAGWPAMSVPAGLSAEGMPLAIQLVGRPGSESQLLAVAAQLERAHPWPRTAPASAASS